MSAPDLHVPFDARVFEREPLRTERLRLRPIEDDDADDVWEYQRLDEVIRYLPWPKRTRDEAEAHTRRRAGGRVLAADEDAVFFVCELPGEAGARGDRVIGDVMLRVASVEHAQLEIGWVFHPDFQGRGFAREAAARLLALAFEELGAHRVHAELSAQNEASAALCRRLGMRFEATLREEEYHHGEWEDTAVYGILDREWRAAG